MYIQLEESEQIKLIDEAIQKAGTYRKLAKLVKIPKASISRYKSLGVIPEKRYKAILNFLGIKEESIKVKRLNDNWKQILGGKTGVKLKKEKGTFEGQLKMAQKSGIEKIKEWHKRMKEENPKEYHLIQYEKFKRIYGYKFVTIKGEKVRNKFEKDVADMLTKLKINYQYEPLIKSKTRWFFPDFLINNKIIIECTEWEGEEKAYQLREKISYFKNKYKTFVIIPKHLYRKYKILDKHLILGLDEIARVAQLVRAHGC